MTYALLHPQRGWFISREPGKLPVLSWDTKRKALFDNYADADAMLNRIRQSGQTGLRIEEVT